jgi:fibronectin type 3 domain-containing protein
MLIISQSLEVSKIKKNKKNFEKVWSSIINKDFDSSFSLSFHSLQDITAMESVS